MYTPPPPLSSSSVSPLSQFFRKCKIPALLALLFLLLVAPSAAQDSVWDGTADWPKCSDDIGDVGRRIHVDHITKRSFRIWARWGVTVSLGVRFSSKNPDGYSVDRHISVYGGRTYDIVEVDFARPGTTYQFIATLADIGQWRGAGTECVYGRVRRSVKTLGRADDEEVTVPSIPSGKVINDKGEFFVEGGEGWGIDFKVLDGNEKTSAISSPKLQALSVKESVDVWGDNASKGSKVCFPKKYTNKPVKVFFENKSSLTPRVERIATWLEDGRICAAVVTKGVVVLVDNTEQAKKLENAVNHAIGIGEYALAKKVSGYVPPGASEAVDITLSIVSDTDSVKAAAFGAGTGAAFCVVGSTILGGVAGTTAGGVGAVPGALGGAKLGLLIAPFCAKIGAKVAFFSYVKLKLAYDVVGLGKNLAGYAYDEYSTDPKDKSGGTIDDYADQQPTGTKGYDTTYDDSGPTLVDKRCMVRINAKLNLRAYPGGPVLGTAPYNALLTAYEKSSDGWYKVDNNGQVGWVSGAYVTEEAAQGGCG